ncbi:hypothetical protein RclHR1_22110002 [Rhizophagus clarus]|uniref:Tyr recombinase domain-containing protein n=1 Tax=Rhizophagus clarus TaxID=94130 RepID=A0A2Z6QTY9_9GLOM|nr:hypothetical protein RclHR1_22110002 [Rhizophagus clarus]
MLHQIATLTGIDLSDGWKIVNHSCRRTAIQMLKDGDVPEDDIMEFSGHRSQLTRRNLDDIEIEEFEYFPGNWENLNINDSDSDSSDNDGLDEDVYNSSSSEVDSEENSDYYNTDNVDDNDKLVKKWKALKEIVSKIEITYEISIMISLRLTLVSITFFVKSDYPQSQS